jgi:hypothetical protein
MHPGSRCMHKIGVNMHAIGVNPIKISGLPGVIPLRSGLRKAYAIESTRSSFASESPYE